METFQKFENLADHAREYVKTKVAKVKLEMAEKISALFAALISAIVVMFIMFVFIIFLGLALADVLGHAFGRPWLGLLAVAGLFLLMALVFISAKERLFRIPIMNSLIRKMFDHKEHDDE